MRARSIAVFAWLAFTAPFADGAAAFAQELLGGRTASALTTMEIGVDRPGSDLFVRPMPGGDAVDCQSLCAATPECRAFSFDRTADSTAALCRIKDAAPAAITAPCCTSGVRAAFDVAPVARIEAAPSPPLRTAPAIATTWPADTIAARNGFGLCLDVKDGLPRDGASARRIQVWDCHGGENQKVMLKGGVIYFGASQSVQMAPALAPLRGRAGIAPGARIEARVIAWDQPAEPVWEHLAATGQIRLIGSGLCLTSPMDDAGPGALVYLDDCTAPMVGSDGARAAPDGRSRFEPVSAAVR